MVPRTYWQHSIDDLWERRNVLWMSGVRRAGKTCLCRSLPEIEYFDCELPRNRRMMEDPEAFLDGLRGRRVVLDEVHRLDDPSQLLKIAADHYADIRILATGSSTLGASTKFRDTLTGRKSELWLTPMMSNDLAEFRNEDLRHRFLRGGLPPFFMPESLPERDFQEWMDAYWAKDIQELFRLERRQSFIRFAELLMANSGGIFEATKYARLCEVSRGTDTNYRGALEATFLAHVIRPFSSRRATEIVSAPKVYAFDTGFVCYHKGITDLRPDDLGFLWEHFVLNELHARLQTRDIRYWRDKHKHEVDLVLVRRGQPPTAIECKWSASDFDARNLRAFRYRYPEGENFVVCNDVERSYTREYDAISVRFVGLESLVDSVA